MQRAVPGRDIERTLAGRAGRADHRSCRNPTGAKDPAAAEVFPPEHIAGFRFDCKDVVGDAGFNQDCFGPELVFTRSAISGTNSECISRTSLSSLTFHSSLMSFALAAVKVMVQPIRCKGHHADLGEREYGR
jgi:hypothetical protein